MEDHGVVERIGLDRWRRDWARHIDPPDSRDHQREATFLRSHWEYGARIHSLTADSLVAALSETQETARRHVLFLKLFAEFVNALETLGAWGWALRHRREFRLFLDGFLSYPIGAPDEFFAAVLADEEATLVSLLGLPPREAIIRATRDLSAEFTSREVGEALDLRMEWLRESADQYFVDESVLLIHYNKAKHGATMLRLPDHTDDELDFQVIAPQRNLEQIRAGKWYAIAEFRATEELIERTRTNIEHTTQSIQHLSLLAWAMQEAGLLYVDPST